MIPLLVVMAALAMGLPTLRGTFVGGDDYRLVLNHVLVNHPSFEHALDLFRIVHRDLYQPIPLLSFQTEFALAGAAGALAHGVDAFAWLFHLDNVLLHAINALLVWLVVRSMCTDKSGSSHDAVAGLAAGLFAVHPLQVEVVAWINGRMMLLSTMFALLAVWSMARWLTVGRHRWAIGVVLFSLFCAMSKIRIGLPVLLIAVPFVLRKRITLRVFWVWLCCAVVTAVFVVVNYRATADAGMFTGAAEHMLGSRMVRGLRSLAWYVEHFVWPVGLASWYPAPGVVAWSDRATWVALAVVGPTFAWLGVWAYRSRRILFGLVWFLSTIAVTLQLVPTRNTLAADRYMYLPIVGLLMIVALGLVRLATMTKRSLGLRHTRRAAGFVVSLLMVVLIAQSWHTAWYYENPVRKAQRLAELNPKALHVWERLAWAYQHDGRYQLAIETARKELSQDDTSVRGAAYLVIGASYDGLGQYEKAIESYRMAMRENPSSTRPFYRIALVYEELGKMDEAIGWLEKAVERAPLKNPWINKLASLYRTVGRRDDAAQLYQQALRNNPFEVSASLGLAELDIEKGTRASYEAAVARLRRLLDWMPENVTAWANLGVTYYALGRVDDAVEAYQEALRRDPSQLTSLLNLGQLYARRGDTRSAWRYYQEALRVGPEMVDQAVAIHDFLMTQNQAARAEQLWNRFLKKHPGSRRAKLFVAWSAAIAGDVGLARNVLARMAVEKEEDSALALATRSYLALMEENIPEALRHVEQLCRQEGSSALVRGRLQRALAQLLLKRENWPWVYCVAARLLIASRDTTRADAFIGFCSERCKDEPCRAEVARLHQLRGALDAG